MANEELTRANEISQEHTDDCQEVSNKISTDTYQEVASVKDNDEELSCLLPRDNREDKSDSDDDTNNDIDDDIDDKGLLCLTPRDDNSDEDEPPNDSRSKKRQKKEPQKDIDYQEDLPSLILRNNDDDSKDDRDGEEEATIVRFKYSRFKEKEKEKKKDLSSMTKKATARRLTRL